MDADRDVTAIDEGPAGTLHALLGIRFVEAGRDWGVEEPIR